MSSLPSPRSSPALPAWPFVAVFLGYPLWWLLGIGDMAWIGLSIIMVAYLLRSRVYVPRGFGVWIVFLIWVACSVINIDTGGRLIGFAYRFMLYLACTIIFVFVYNARKLLTIDRILAVLTGFWVIVWIGGYLGLLFPTLEIRTPLAWILPNSLLNNELVREMAIRRLTQYNPDAFNVIAPRPSAPFLYTNGWGNAYSILLPLVFARLSRLRPSPRYWTILVMIPISLVPAFLSLNRGMLIGLAVITLYVGLRLLVRGEWRPLLVIGGSGLVAGVIFTLLPVAERLTNRLSVSSTTEDRYALYLETLRRTVQSPLFGYGAPRPSEIAGAPSVGTQGQLWMEIFSHGFVGAALFVLWLVILLTQTRRAVSTAGLICHAVVLATLVEIAYYGVVASGLVLALVSAAMALRMQGTEHPAVVSRRPRPPRHATHLYTRM